MASPLKLEIVLSMVDKALAPLRGIDRQAKGSAQSLKATRDRLKDLERAQDDLGDFRKLRTGMRGTQTALQASQDKVRGLAQQIAQAGTPTKALSREFATAKREAATLSEQFQQQSQRAQQLRDRLSAAGMSTRNLATHERELRGSIASTTESLNRKTEALRRQGEQQRQLAAIAAQQRQAPTHNTTEPDAHPNAESRAVRTVERASARLTSHAPDFGQTQNRVQTLTRLDQSAPGLRMLRQQAPNPGNRATPTRRRVPDLEATMPGALDIAQASNTGLSRATGIDSPVPRNSAIHPPMGRVADMPIPASTTSNAKLDMLSKTLARIDLAAHAAGSNLETTAPQASTLGSVGIQGVSAGTGLGAVLLQLSAAASGTAHQFEKLSVNAQSAANSIQSMQPLLAGIAIQTTTPDAGDPASVAPDLLGAAPAAALAQTGAFTSALDAWAQANPRVAQTASEVTSALGRFLSVGNTLLNTLESVVGKITLLHTVFKHARPLAADLSNNLKKLAGALGSGLNAAAKMSAKAVPGALMRIGLAIQALPSATWALGRSMAGAFGLGAAAIRRTTLRLGAYIAAQKAVAMAGARRGLANAGASMVMRGSGGIAKDAGAGLANIGKAGTVGAFGAISNAIRGVTLALRVMGAAALMNPIGLAVAVIAGAALLIFKFWEPIKAFFVGMWAGFTEGLAPLKPMFAALFGAWASMLEPLRPVWDWLIGAFSAAWDWVTRLLGPFQATKETLDGATQAGHGFGAWLAGLIVTAAELVGKFFGFGHDIVMGLINGITSMFGAIADTAANLASGIADRFKSLLGIRSPSRVMMAAGADVGEGAAVGIANTLGLVQKSAAAMATVAAIALPVPALATPATGLPATQPASPAATALPPKLPALPDIAVRMQPPAQPMLGELVARIQPPELPRMPARLDLPYLPVAAAHQPQALPGQPEAIRIDRRPTLAPHAPAARPAPVVHGDTITLHIHAAPGMDPQAVAQAVAAELDRRERAKAARMQAAFIDYQD